MILALTIEPVNPTMNKKKIRIKIITEYEIFLGKLLLERINNTPKMIYDMWVPDVAKICIKLLFLK